jgi:(1->4)-alpha-D-glucan 1-alpha-D-glucosylmutase
VHTWLDAVLDGPVAAELTSLVERLDLYARSDSLSQKLLALTVPGVPDVYQGTELWEDSLVDPDNRRPVDYGVRREALKGLAHPKLRVATAALRLRRDRPDSFIDGGYTPVLAEGSAAEHLVAFVRGHDVMTAVTRHAVRLSEVGWNDTALALPGGVWVDRIGGGRYSGRVLAIELFATMPVALLERLDD